MSTAPLDSQAIAGRERHRPRTQEEMRAVVHEMAARGLTPRDIAAVLEIGVGAVQQLLGETATPREAMP